MADGNIVVVLVGGPMDGEEWEISPICSLGLPSQLRYLSSDNKEAIWHVYEFPVCTGPCGGASWDTSPDRMIYNYIGKRPLLGECKNIKTGVTTK